MKNYKVRLTVTETYDITVQANNKWQVNLMVVGMLNRGELETENGHLDIEMEEIDE